MKNKGIWFVIAGIIAVGIVITMVNTVFIKKQVQVEFLETAIREDTAASGLGEAYGLDSPSGEVTKGDAPQEEGKEETQPPQDKVLITPLETAGSAAEEEGMQGADGEAVISRASGRMAPSPQGKASDKDSYHARLDELNQQILKIRGDETDSTTYSVKAAAENELKLWDSELNNIYNDILDRLSEQEKARLVNQERDWLKARDSKAVEAAKKSPGGFQEGVEYTASLAESTKQRAYELADYYDQLTQP